MKTVSACVALALLAVSVPVSAVPLVWTLNNVTTLDGQSLTGSFTYDRDTQTFSSISIANSGTLANPSTTWDTLFYFNLASSPSLSSNYLTISLTNGPQNLTNRVLSSKYFDRCFVREDNTIG